MARDDLGSGMQDGDSEPERALLTARIIWAALFIGVAIFLGIVLKIMAVAPPPLTSGTVVGVMRAMPMGALLLVPVGYVIRGQQYKRHWVGDVVTPVGFLTGNLMLFALLEAVMVLAVISCLCLGSFVFGGPPLVLAALIHLANFPQPGVMLPPRGG